MGLGALRRRSWEAEARGAAIGGKRADRSFPTSALGPVLGRTFMVRPPREGSAPRTQGVQGELGGEPRLVGRRLHFTELQAV